MGAQGPNSGSVFTSDNTIGSIALSNPANAAISDDTYVTAVLLLNQTSQLLKATGFNFTIPLDAIIDGIVVEVERSGSVLNGITDNAVRIVKGGAIGSTDRSAGSSWPTTDAYQTYGGTTDRWGETWSPADINAANFGASVGANALIAATAQIDHIRISIYYTGSNRPAGLSGRLKAGEGEAVSNGPT